MPLAQPPLAYVATPPAAISVATTPPPPAAMTDDGVTAWRKAYIAEAGDVFVNWGDQSIVYFAYHGSNVLPNGLVRGWLRAEYFAPVAVASLAVRSEAALNEFDCEAGRFRELAFNYYPFNNLQGAPSEVNEQSPQWVYPRPATVGELMLTMACQMKALPPQPADNPSSPVTPAPTVRWTTEPPAQ